jgi:hypothetical protein
MPVHIEEMSSDVTVVDGDLPLSEAQLNKLVQRVLKALSDKQRESQQSREATTLRREAAPPLRIGD